VYNSIGTVSVCRVRLYARLILRCELTLMPLNSYLALVKLFANQSRTVIVFLNLNKQFSGSSNPLESWATRIAIFG
jgi:hypothetical protein